MLTEYKLNPADFAGKNVSALPDRPGEAGMTAAQLKAAFDRSGEEVIASHINGLIDVLVGDTGADQIGTQSGDSVGKLLTKAVNSETVRHLKKDAKGALMISENGSTWTYASLDGHIVVDREGAILPPRKHLVFMNSLAEDNSGRDATIIYGVKGDQGEKGEKGDQGDPVTVNGKSGPHILLTCGDLSAAEASALTSHAANQQNPHKVTAAQVGALSLSAMLMEQYTVTAAPPVTMSGAAVYRLNAIAQIKGVAIKSGAFSTSDATIIGSIPADVAPTYSVYSVVSAYAPNGAPSNAILEINPLGELKITTQNSINVVQLQTMWMLA
ncbi:MAG: hypothetical protein SOR38_07545 [Oscillospiraceae bacterium]|nr:hypothetical protein [Oscillospiraceae bacterium]MDY3065646.1 hypothetical protein [Oscillospiraceae bacterium]